MASIIKSPASLERLSGKMVQPVSFTFADISHRADNYLDSIRKEAAKIIAEAHEQAEVIRRNSEQAGRKAAEEAIDRILTEKVAVQMKTLRPAIEELVAKLDDARNEWREHWDHAGIKLAAAIAQRIVRSELANRPEITLDFVREALTLAGGSSHVVVKLNPNDLQNLGNQLESLTASVSRLAPTEIVADASVSPGGCRVATQFGEIDQQIESQLARIIEELGEW